jgi:tetratricopeptide (TPR) repeat protein
LASASKSLYKGCVLLGAKVLTTMAKPGRNDPCPCGSGNKYKKCCLPKEELIERRQLAEAEARRAEHAAARRLELREMRTAIAARLAGQAQADDKDELTVASHAVVHLVKAGKLDAAEAAARNLLMRYPEMPNGWDCLGVVHEARGENRQAADCYRKMTDIMRQHPNDYDTGYEDEFATLIARLDPPAAT